MWTENATNGFPTEPLGFLLGFYRYAPTETPDERYVWSAHAEGATEEELLANLGRLVRRLEDVKEKNDEGREEYGCDRIVAFVLLSKEQMQAVRGRREAEDDDGDTG